MIRSRYYGCCFVLATIFLVPSGAGLVSAQTVFTVNSTDDDSDSNPGDGTCYTGQQILTGSADECTLRAAIEEANAFSGADTVKFNIDRGAADTDCVIFGEPPTESAQSGDGYCEITPASALPNITQTVVILGDTQPFASCGTSNATRDLLIVVDGSSAGASRGLTLVGAHNSRINGLVINNFQLQGIYVAGGTNNAWLTCNYIGVNHDGTSAAGNVVGVGSGDGTQTGLIVGTNGDGIDDEAEGNVVSGNSGRGINMGIQTDDFWIAGNYVGLAPDGSTSMPNGTDGMYAITSTGLIGSNGDGTSDDLEENRIAYNGDKGIEVFNGAVVAIRRNRMFNNTSIGIDAGADGPTPNDPGDADVGKQNFPDVQSAILRDGILYVTYSIDSETTNSAYPLEVEFFKADSDGDEGARYIATAVYDDVDYAACGSPPCSVVSQFSAPGFIAAGDSLVATATDDVGNTSEFSDAVLVASNNFVVNSTADDADFLAGDGICATGIGSSICTLRAAIEETNALAGQDTVLFDIASGGNNCIPYDAPAGFGAQVPGALCSILPDSALPSIDDRLILLGESQPGVTCGTTIANRALAIILDGANAGVADGLTLANGASSSRISGLMIRNFDGDGIQVEATGGVHIACSNIGTDENGVSAPNTGSGINITADNEDSWYGVRDDNVGDGGEGNLISGNGAYGIDLAGAPGCTIAGNYIGVNRLATLAIPNGLDGIRIRGVGGQATSTTIGTDGDGNSDNSEYNVIGGNTSSGILMSGGNVYNNVVSGNYIGTNPTRTVALPNGGNGITVTGAAHDITIGDPDNPNRNYIAYNGGNGINVSGETTGPVAMISNQIWENDLLGINIAPAGVNANDPGDSDSGPNNLMNYPSIASATVQSTNLIISYSVDSDSAITKYPLRVEFFEADADHEEGQTLIGFDEYSASDYAGCGSPPCNVKVSFFSTGLSAADTLVATSTDAGGEWNTSEFSPPMEITEGSGASISLLVKAFLEGPFAGGQMSKALNTGGSLPLTQPFGDALFDGKWVDYDSVQTVVSHNDSTVDWVLVALLSDVDPDLEIPGTRHAAVISENGIVTTPGSDSLVFNGVADGNYALLLGARNHITIMSASTFPVTGGVGSYDFTTAATQAFGTDAMKSLSGGVWGLFGGDSNADGNVTAPDFNDWNAATSAGATGYQQSDFNMDGIVTAPDFNLWNANTSAGASSKLPN